MNNPNGLNFPASDIEHGPEASSTIPPVQLQDFQRPNHPAMAPYSVLPHDPYEGMPHSLRSLLENGLFPRISENASGNWPI